jgi:uncharacterized protein
MRIEDIKLIITPLLLKHEVTRAGIFGSMARGTGAKRSDLDILVEFGKQISLLQFAAIKHEIQDAVQMPVDLVEYQALKPRLRDAILLEEHRIYG